VPQTPEQKRAWYVAKRARGECYDCAKAPLRGQTRCKYHQAVNRVSSRQSHATARRRLGVRVMPQKSHRKYREAA